MEKDLLRFKKIIEIGNLSKAAEILYTTQPALTHLIKRLEKKYSAKLLIRGRTGIKPTRVGEILYRHVIDLEVLNKNFQVRLEELISNHPANNLRIGIVDSVAEDLIKKGLFNLRRQPDIEIDRTDNLLSLTENGLLDFCIALDKEKYSEHLVKRLLFNENLYLISSHNLNLILDKEFDFISYNRNSNTHSYIEQQLFQNDLKVNYIFNVSSPKIILNLVENGYGFALLPENVFEGSTKIKVYKDFKFSRPISLYYLKGKIFSSFEQEILSLIDISIKDL